MRVLSVPITPFPDQRPGTSGLRKKVAVFQQPGYLEAFVQSIFDALPEAVGDSVAGKRLVLGGDGRFFNDAALQVILRLMAANGVAEVLLGLIDEDPNSYRNADTKWKPTLPSAQEGHFAIADLLRFSGVA